MTNGMCQFEEDTDIDAEQCRSHEQDLRDDTSFPQIAHTVEKVMKVANQGLVEATGTTTI